jgi:hypothetical protein
MRPIAAISLLLLCPCLRAGQDAKPKLYAPWVTCFDETGQHFIGPKSMKTPVLASPDQRNRAYAENEARHDSRFPESCENTATLYVSVSGAPFRPVFTQSKASPENMNAGSLGPAAWSGNSRWLFIEQAVLSYGSDCCGYDFLLYDAATQRIVQPDIFDAVQRIAGKQCDPMYAGFLGFNAKNQLIVRINYWRDFYENGVSCGPGSADWLFDPVTNKARLRTSRPERSRK